MVKAVIFDMDGLLIDSEPMWRESEMHIFGQYGIQLTEDDCRGTTGMRVDEVLEHWSLIYPGANLDCKKAENEIIDYVANLVDIKGVAMPGVIEAIEFLKKKKIPLAIASASSLKLIEKVLAKLNIQHEFSIIQSAEFMNYGKPHPEVFLETAKKLNVRPEYCLVFEDSEYGVLAGKAAKMQVIAIPDVENLSKKGYCIADAKLNSLHEFTEQVWKDLN
jgi:sugar-phosphatase